MDATLSLLNLAGAIALLLWGVHMVQSGIPQQAILPRETPNNVGVGDGLAVEA